jgi:molybdopterin-dependent oxidoreductase-like protein protein
MALGRRLRPSRRTNVALAVLVPATLLSGALAFAIGSGWVAWTAVAHGVLALAIVVLSPWKSAISARGIRRRGSMAAWPSMLLGLAILLVVVTGLSHSTGMARTFGPVSAMQVHLGAALASIPLFLWHLFARPVAARRTDLSRRTVLRSAALTGASVAAYGGITAITRLLALPGDDRRATGSYEAGSFDPGEMPVTQWLDDTAPAPDAAWRLAVRTPTASRTYTLDELAGFGDRVRAVLDCTGGWYSTQDWEGVWLSRLLPDATANSIAVRSATGFWRRFPATDVGSLFLAVRVGAEPLAEGHGAPLRLVAPGRRGFWWVKWVTSIEADDTPWWWQPPFPVT